ncbi:MAG: sortase [Lactococcus chungangensis]|nr:sortase [Lactococcus chungangensis]
MHHTSSSSSNHHLFKGTTDYTLSLGASTYLTDTPAGQGNLILSGHSTPYKGVLFTDLNQVKKGDEIIVRNG